MRVSAARTLPARTRLLPLALVFSGLLLAGRVRGEDASDSSPNPPPWRWKGTEPRRIQTLARLIRKGDDGYWSFTEGEYQVRSDVSATLTAEAACYVKILLRTFPRVFGLQPPGRACRFRLVLHGTDASFAGTPGASRGERGCANVSKRDDGLIMAEVHVRVNSGDTVETDGARINTVPLGVLQRQAAYALLQTCAPGNPVPAFLREGCATYFETWDVRIDTHGGESRAAGLAGAASVDALKSAIQSDASFCPDLFEALNQSAEAFSANDPLLQRALAASFVDFLLSSPPRRPLLQRLVEGAARTSEGAAQSAPSWVLDPDSAAALEPEWHKHLCRMAAHALPVQGVTFAVDDGPGPSPSHTKLSPYGNKPMLSVQPGTKGAYYIAWYGGGAIHVLPCDADNTKLSQVSPSFIEGAANLLGFAPMPRDGSYVVGYAKDNASGDRAFEYWIARFDRTGKKIFNTRIFGEKSSQDLWAKGQPGAAGTARIVYNEASDRIGFYCGHTMKWPDNVRHQGGYIGFLRPNGSQLMHGDKPIGNGWFFSHNFDQRLIVADGSYYALAHGDAYPRALGFSKWSGDSGGKNPAVNQKYYTIPGEAGANVTHCQTGGLVPLGDKQFAVLFATSNDRPSHDVCLKVLGEDGAALREKWLTSYGEDTYAAYPRIARYGPDVLVAWEKVAAGGSRADIQLMAVNASLETVVRPTTADGVHVSPSHDMVTLDNGAVAWASSPGNGEIRLYRIDEPGRTAERFMGLLAQRASAAAAVARVAPDIVEGIDKKVIAKLAGLSKKDGLPSTPMRISRARVPVRLVQAEEGGALTFAAGTGAQRKTAVFAYGDLSPRDRAAVALCLLTVEPDNRTLYGVAAFYLECAGDGAGARKYYHMAGKAIADAFAALRAKGSN